MKYFIAMILGLIMLLPVASAGAAGFQRVMIPDPGDRPIEAGIWYPSLHPGSAEGNPFDQTLSLDGPLAAGPWPLIIISHGKGGWMGGHAGAALALANAGFVVVAVTHTGDNKDDESYPASRWLLDRPRHISRAIDYMLAQWPGHDNIDSAKIGVFGFSAGGYTALAVAGGTFNPQKVSRHCAEQPEELVCKEGMSRDFKDVGVKQRFASAQLKDSRVKAVAVAAPGFGFGFDTASLATNHHACTALGRSQ